MLLLLFLMIAATGALKWAVKEGSGVSVRSAGGVLEFAGQVPSSAVLAAPFRRENSKSLTFIVQMPRKVGRTAIGFQLASPTCFEYLTPSHSPSTRYISFGGAGFLYPSKSSARGGYSEGDRVTATLTWATNTVSYSVNSVSVGEVPFPSTVDVAFPSLSVEAGAVTAETTVTEH